MVMYVSNDIFDYFCNCDRARSLHTNELGTAMDLLDCCCSQTDPKSLPPSKPKSCLKSEYTYVTCEATSPALARDC